MKLPLQNLFQRLLPEQLDREKEKGNRIFTWLALAGRL